MNQSWVTIDVNEVVRETDRAILIRLQNGHEQWVPRSQIENSDDFSTGDCDVEMSISEWFATKEDLL